MSITVKMVRGKTYACPKVFGDDVLVRGDVRKVSEEDAELLLSETYMDKLNNEHHYFEEVGDDEEGQDEDAGGKAPASGKQAPAKKAAAPRRRSR